MPISKYLRFDIRRYQVKKPRKKRMPVITHHSKRLRFNLKAFAFDSEASSAGASSAGASSAGASSAGASVAGASVAGASVAGASVADASSVGSSSVDVASSQQSKTLDTGDSNGFNGFDHDYVDNNSDARVEGVDNNQCGDDSSPKTTAAGDK
ncbi:hypothetical protein BC941DRAFT_408292 [Chlamydoabsidia padenii]|nr:hypothetical protein BC941DRAFT_408292 [Chlamydoabsidia padenii]